MTNVYVEARWLSPGQPPRKMLLCYEYPSKCPRLSICWDFKKGEDKVTHGDWAVIEMPREDNADMLILKFHHSNTNCYKLVEKRLYAQGFGVWRDSSCCEILLVEGLEEMTSPTSFHRNSFHVKFDDEQVLNEIGRENFVKRADGIYPNFCLHYIKFVLRWMHPGMKIQYVLLLVDHSIVFVDTQKEVSPPNGSWKYDQGIGFVTHFHCKGLKDHNNEPDAPLTVLQRLESEVTEVEHPFPMETFAVGGTEDDDASAHSDMKRLRLFDDSELYKAKRWHIVSQKVWP